LRPAGDQAARQQQLIVRFLVHALRGAGATQLTEEQPPASIAARGSVGVMADEFVVSPSTSPRLGCASRHGG
jgi:hypothetical protein